MLVRKGFHRAAASVAGALAVLGTAASPVDAQGYRGGPGDRRDTDHCPHAQAIVGFVGGSYAWIDRIGIVCAPATREGPFAPAAYNGPVRGGPGGVPGESRCPVGFALASLRITLTPDNRMLKNVSGTCWNPRTREQSPLRFGAGDHDRTAYIRRCEGWVTGLTVGHGKHVNGGDVICGVGALPVR